MVVGAGRVGSSLALALRARGAHLAGFVAGTPEGRARAESWLGIPAAPSIGELVSLSPDLCVVAVPDDVLPGVAKHLGNRLQSAGRARRADPVVLHTSGATSVTVLDPCAETGAVTLVFHPLQTFPEPAGGSTRFVGSAVAITPGSEGEDSPAGLFGFALARSLEARPFFLPDERRTLYHAAATMACNYLVTLEHQAETLFVRAGLPKERALSFFMPLVTTTVQSLEAQGTMAALTGPLSRGDRATVARHLEALLAEEPSLVPLYRVLGLATLDLVRARGEVDPHLIGELVDLLGQPRASEHPVGERGA